MASTASLDVLAIVGTGFMGASIAAAAKRRGIANHVIGIDRQSAQQALSLGHIDAQAESIAQLPQLCSQRLAQNDRFAIAIVIASPVHTYSQIFSELSNLSQMLKASQAITWITDIGSTKSGVLKAANNLGNLASAFVSSHPMAGSEKHGPADARADLFQSARVLISRLPQSTDNAVAAVEDFWITLGGQPSLLPIEEHDELLAAISHLPHAVAYSLAGVLAGSPLAGAAQALHGGGLRDTTRIAASSPELWADIFLDNREQLLAAWSEWSLHVEVTCRGHA
ncbi:MAG: prephenate dehydrogenase/arogenate dehydrogenase family protein [Betaproteobacteria bacterium]|nr:prephenate dehydrogenase/arogenate dehydrogenase family protein [Betaproteobacteria bacterium]